MKLSFSAAFAEGDPMETTVQGVEEVFPHTKQTDKRTGQRTTIEQNYQREEKRGQNNERLVAYCQYYIRHMTRILPDILEKRKQSTGCIFV